MSKSTGHSQDPKEFMYFPDFQVNHAEETLNLIEFHKVKKSYPEICLILLCDFLGRKMLRTCYLLEDRALFF